MIAGLIFLKVCAFFKFYIQEITFIDNIEIKVSSPSFFGRAGVAKSQKTILVHGQPFRKFNLSVAELHLSVNVYINYKRIY